MTHNVASSLKKNISAVCLIKNNNNLLMTTRTRPPMEGYLEFPGGKQEGTETPEETCIRELYEETCLLVSQNNLIRLTYKESDTIRLTFFIAHSWEGRFIARDKQKHFWIPLLDIIHAYSILHQSTIILKGHPILPNNKDILQKIIRYLNAPSSKEQ